MLTRHSHHLAGTNVHLSTMTSAAIRNLVLQFPQMSVEGEDISDIQGEDDETLVANHVAHGGVKFQTYQP